MTKSGALDLILPTTHFQVSPGVSVTIPVGLVNHSEQEERVQLVLEGVPDDWVAITNPEVQVKPGERQEIQFRIRPPRSNNIKTGQYLLCFRASSLTTLGLQKEIRASLLVGIVLFE